MNRMHPFLIISYLVNLVIKIIPLFLLYLIFQEISSKKMSVLMDYRIILTITLLLLVFGFYKWRVMSYLIIGDQIQIKSFSFFQQTIDTLDEKKVTNVTTIKRFPNNLFDLVDIQIQLEGDQEESTISLPSLRRRDFLLITDLLNRGQDEFDAAHHYRISLKESLGGILSKGFFLSLSVIFISTLVANIEETERMLDCLTLDYWLTSFSQVRSDVYLFALMLLIFSTIAQISTMLNFTLQINHELIKITSGIFSLKHTYVYKENVKDVIVSQNPIQRLFQRTSVYLDAVNLEEKKILLHPFIEVNKLSDLVYNCYEERLDSNNMPWERQGGLRLFLIGLLISFILSIYSLLKFPTINWLSMFFVFSLFLLSYLFIRYASTKYLFEEERLLLTKGVFYKKTLMFKQENLEYVRTRTLLWNKKKTQNVKLSFFNHSSRRKVILRGIQKNRCLVKGE